MTAGAVADIVDAFVRVAADHLCLVVALEAGILHKRGRMAVAAGPTRPTVVNGEGMRPVEFRRDPGRGRVAAGAVETEQARMVGRIRVAAGAGGGRALEYDPPRTLDVAARAGNFQVRSGQGEDGFVMVKSGRNPTRRDVAQAAVLPQLAFVSIVLGVTGIAGLRSPFEDIIDVAGRAVHADVLANQRE